MADETRYNDGIQHGIDNNPNGDAEKGAALGGIGGAVTGLAAGAVAGPVGAILGAVIGGVAGAAASGAAVAAVDRVDNDNTISGLGNGVTSDLDEDDNSVYNTNYNGTAPSFFTDDNGAQYFVDSDGHRIYTDETNRYYYTDINSGNRTYVPTPTWGNGVPGIQTGGYTAAGTPDSRGISEKVADAVTGDNYDDKQGVPVANSSTSYSSTDNGIHGVNRLPGEAAPSLKTGGYANDGTPDTRGAGEKFVDAVTGDVIDDKTGKVVDHS
jgi:hypothetical protein